MAENEALTIYEDDNELESASAYLGRAMLSMAGIERETTKRKFNLTMSNGTLRRVNAEHIDFYPNKRIARIFNGNSFGGAIWKNVDDVSIDDEAE